MSNLEKSEPCPIRPAGCRITQTWTIGGQPIVDRKYLDLTTGEIKELAQGEQVTYGPPAVDIYVHNQLAYPDPTIFRSTRYALMSGVTEYMSRLGDFMKKGLCEIHSVNVTKYSVTLVILIDKKYQDIRKAMVDCGLLGAS
ncbi:hypothetical protein BJ170DRAFT_609494 [Xylariales sp. AK1849]|nr:hypothetical protein BJ170DRAFT_609494 [Xylariales sp. AK1849]